eukprot:sb/3473577/
MIRIGSLIALLLITAFGESDVPEDKASVGNLGSSGCGAIDEKWVLAATKYDLFSADILNETTVVLQNDTVNNSNDQNTYTYRIDGVVKTFSKIDFERPPEIPELTNLALGQVAVQSSTDINGYAFRAVDGDRNGLGVSELLIFCGVKGG